MTRAIPSALAHLDAILARVRRRDPAVFLDFDGTLAAIVDHPERAAIDAAMRDAVARLARLCPVAIISGRDLEDVTRRVGIDGICYAGSHGFDIAGPNGLHHQHPRGIDALPALDAAERELRAALGDVPGVLVERKRFSLAVHYRLARTADIPVAEHAVAAALRRHGRLRGGHGKRVLELQPDVDWHKGAAVLWLLATLGLARPGILPICIGDDTTDEDAFKALKRSGIGIVVAEHARPSAAHYRVHDPGEVRRFLTALAAALEQKS
jgi:trehalose-phosphatase